MEYLEGGSFDSYIKAENGLSESEALTCIRLIGDALQFMHNNRMLHLDLKPNNIMRRKHGSIVLIDLKGHFWIGTHKGLWLFDRETNRCKKMHFKVDVYKRQIAFCDSLPEHTKVDAFPFTTQV